MATMGVEEPEQEVQEVTPEERAPEEVTVGVDPRPRPYRDWRGMLTAASGLNLLAGVWLIVSPFVLDYESGDASWNAIACGALVALLAWVRTLGAYGAAWMSWIVVVIGTWLFLSGFWLTDSSAASWNSWLFGLIVALTALFSIDATEEARSGPG